LKRALPDAWFCPASPRKQQGKTMQVPGRMLVGLLSVGLLAAGISAVAIPTAEALAAPQTPQKAKARAKQKPLAHEAPPTKEGLAFFENKIRPVLVHNCYQCHSGDPAKAKGHLVLDTHDGIRQGGDSGAALVPRHAETSLLIEAIKYEGLEMPPKGKLPDETIEDFVTWIGMGAPDPRVGKAAQPKNKVDLAQARHYWAFQPPKASPPPKLRDTRWPVTEIDQFIRGQQEKEKLTPVADAHPVTLVRRVTFDLTGLPATPEEIDAFVADTSAGAYEKVVNRLLGSPQFGERWGRHWLDVVRFGESTGKDRNIPYRYAWRYRDYVIDAFNQGKPYDRFIVEQLAGDLLPAKDAADHDRLVIATGFLAIGPKGVNTKPEQFRMDQIDDQIDVTGRAMLGLTIACARCHDHKFDPIPTTDYYAMAGIFQSTQTFSGAAPGRKTAVDDRLLTLASFATPKVSSDEAQAEKDRQEEIAKIQAQIRQLRNPPKQPKQPARGSQQRQAKGMKQNPFVTAPRRDPKKTQKQIKELNDRLDELAGVPTTTVPLAMGVRDADTPGNCNVLDRGVLENKGPEVPRGVLTVLKTSASAQIPARHSGRLELARWIASKDNPLTARVMVNRVWQHLFGQGLVDTVDNFGALGNEPSNPALLDLLAVRFMEENWSVKKLIRSIVLSRVYRLSSDHNDDNFEKDPANKFLWRMECRRLDAEEIRDAMLLASGQLDLKRPESAPIMALTNKPVGRGMGLQTPNFRSVYLSIPRGVVPESLQVFDMADPNLIMGKRDVTTVPTQALYFMNNPFVLRQAEQLARRVLSLEGLDSSGRIVTAYRLTLGRVPSESEKSTVARFLMDYRKSLEGGDRKANAQLAAWTNVCQTLFAAGEFRYVY
jgi:hypothetical protein